MDINTIFSKLPFLDLLMCQKLLISNLKCAKDAQRAKSNTLDVNNYVTLRENFVSADSDDVLLGGLFAEAQSLEMKPGRPGSTQTKWMSNDNEAYSWTSRTGHETVNQPISFDSFPSVKMLMEKINR